MQKMSLRSVVIIALFFIGCTGTKDNETQLTSDQVQKKILENAKPPSAGDVMVYNSLDKTADTKCSYVTTFKTEVSSIQNDVVYGKNTKKTELVSGSGCQAGQEEKDQPFSIPQTQLTNELLMKASRLSNPLGFLAIVPDARNVQILSITETKKRSLKTVKFEIQFVNNKDGRFYKYKALVSLDSYFAGVLEWSIEDTNNEALTYQTLNQLILHNPIVSYP